MSALDDAIFKLAAKDGYVYQEGDITESETETDSGSSPDSWDPDGYNSMWESASSKSYLRIYRPIKSKPYLANYVWSKEYYDISEALQDLFSV